MARRASAGKARVIPPPRPIFVRSSLNAASSHAQASKYVSRSARPERASMARLSTTAAPLVVSKCAPSSEGAGSTAKPGMAKRTSRSDGPKGERREGASHPAIPPTTRPLIPAQAGTPTPSLASRSGAKRTRRGVNARHRGDDYSTSARPDGARGKTWTSNTFLNTAT